MNDNSMKQLYLACASSLGYGDLTTVKTGTEERKTIITECADGYIAATKSGDEGKRSAYISALMLLFWGEISKMAEKCKAVKELEYEDFASKLYECINTACEYHAWESGKHNAEQCIRSVIASRGTAAILYESNLDKNKLNYNTCSLDLNIETGEDRETTILDTIEDEDANKFKSEFGARHFIQGVIDRGDIMSAIILDVAVFFNSWKEVNKLKTAIDETSGEQYEYKMKHYEFSKTDLTKTLRSLPRNYKEYFLANYTVKELLFDAALSRIQAVNSAGITKLLNALKLQGQALRA